MMPEPSTPGEAWQGNLPCCHGPKDGCAAHNPDRVAIFWNPSLPSPIKPVTDGFFKAFLGRKNDTSQNKPDVKPAITSILPQIPEALDPLPLIHASVPYTLSLYHLHALATTSASPSSILQSLTCHGTTACSSSRPLTWEVTPRLWASDSASNSIGSDDRSLLIRHSYTTRIALPAGAAATLADTTTFSHQKLPLGCSPFSHDHYTFRACPHATRRLRTLTLHVSKGVASVRVEHVAAALPCGGEVKAEWEWRSDRVDGDQAQPADVACAMCFTDCAMRFELDVGRAEVRVTVQVWKDLGWVRAAAGGEKWEAARGGRPVERESADFGRVRRAFEEGQQGLRAVGGPVLREGSEDVKGGVGLGELVNQETVVHVADGMRPPPPPYTP